MNCPYCKRTVGQPLDTGFMEASKFRKHLAKCRKNPNNLVLPDAGGKTVVTPLRDQTLLDALEIRSESGQ